MRQSQRSVACSICWENLENLPDYEAGRMVASKKVGVKLSSARCGHVFHDFCIRRWLVRQKEMRQMKECPCCRIKIGCLKTLHLSIDDGSEDENENVTNRNSCQMFFICSICCENLGHPSEDETARAATEELLEVKLSSARCGHVFHDFCITKWLVRQRETGGSATCPCCRTKIGCLKTLYVSINDNDKDGGMNLTTTIPIHAVIAAPSASPSPKLISKPAVLRLSKNNFNRCERKQFSKFSLSLPCRIFLVLSTMTIAFAIFLKNS